MADLKHKANPRSANFSGMVSLVVILFLTCFIQQRSAASVYQERPSGVGSYGDRQLSPLDVWRYLLSMEVRQPSPPPANNFRRALGSDNRKRGGSSSCLFNAGLAHNCDYRDVVGAVNEMNHWGSDLAPGRRRKRDVINQQRNEKRTEEFESANSNDDIEDFVSNEGGVFPVNLLRQLLANHRMKLR